MRPFLAHLAGERGNDASASLDVAREGQTASDVPCDEDLLDA